jgi:hypothetical protein
LAGLAKTLECFQLHHRLLYLVVERPGDAEVTDFLLVQLEDLVFRVRVVERTGDFGARVPMVAEAEDSEVRGFHLEPSRCKLARARDMWLLKDKAG